MLIFIVVFITSITLVTRIILKVGSKRENPKRNSRDTSSLKGAILEFFWSTSHIMYSYFIFLEFRAAKECLGGDYEKLLLAKRTHHSNITSIFIGTPMKTMLEL